MAAETPANVAVARGLLIPSAIRRIARFETTRTPSLATKLPMIEKPVIPAVIPAAAIRRTPIDAMRIVTRIRGIQEIAIAIGVALMIEAQIETTDQKTVVRVFERMAILMLVVPKIGIPFREAVASGITEVPSARP